MGSHEKIKDMKGYNQLEEKLFEKENEIHKLNMKLEEKLLEKKENEVIFETNKKLETKLLEKEKEIVDLRAQFQKTIIKVKTEQNKMYKEKIRLMKNEMNLQKSKLKNKYWEEQEALKENLCPEKFQQKETQINCLQKQLLE